MTDLAWGAHVSAAFRSRVQEIAAGLGIEADWLMAVMFQESSLDPAAHNPSGATGLIQFMPQTAAALGTTTAVLAKMPAEQQLEFVADYYRPWTGRMHSVADAYGVVIWPPMVGRPGTYVCFDKKDPKHPARYVQNKGLDYNSDGLITAGEIAARVLAKLAEGRGPHNIWSDDGDFGASLTRAALG